MADDADGFELREPCLPIGGARRGGGVAAGEVGRRDALLESQAVEEAFGGVGAVDISAGQLKLSAPHGLLTHLNL